MKMLDRDAFSLISLKQSDGVVNLRGRESGSGNPGEIGDGGSSFYDARADAPVTSFQTRNPLLRRCR